MKSMEELKNETTSRIGRMKEKARSRKTKRTVIAIAVAIVAVYILANLSMKSTAGMKKFKSLQSEFFGLDRTVTAYDYTGNPIKVWTGKVDITEYDNGTKVLFELDGKRIAIYNTPVIVEEN